MSLSLALRKSIRTILAKAFVAENVKNQFINGTHFDRRDMLMGMGVDPLVAASYALCFAVSNNVELRGTTEHFALRTQLGLGDPKPWHKAAAPTNVWDLISKDRNPSWVDEYNAIDQVAQTIAYADVFDNGVFRDDAAHILAAAIRSHLGIGGLEDIYDSRAVGPADVTMSLLLEPLSLKLRTVNPSWYTGAPVPEYDALSIAERLEIAEREIEAKRVETRRAAAAAQRARHAAEYVSRRDAAFGILETAGAADNRYVTAIRGCEFAQLLAVFGPDVTFPSELNELVALLPGYTAHADDSADDVTKGKAHAAKENAELVTQFIIRPIVQAHPNWFRELSNGDSSLRKEPVKLKSVTLTRTQKAIRNGIENLVEKYTASVVVAELATLFSLYPKSFVIPEELNDIVVTPEDEAAK
jgi:hypothetical protein